MTQIKFNLQNYPKSYGNTDKNYFRLNDFLNSKDLVKIERKLWLFIKSKAIFSVPITEYKDLEFIGNGWEWSVFRNGDKVIKIPAGIFSEVDDIKYLENSIDAYKKILKYYPKKFIADTKFRHVDGKNVIEQKYIESDFNFVLSYLENDKELLRNINEFLDYTLKMLDEEEWMPDINVKRKLKGYGFRVLIDEGKNPILIDFTYYYDPFRIFPERKKEEIENKRKKILLLKRFIERKLM